MTHQFKCDATELDVRRLMIELRDILSKSEIGDDLQSSVEIAVAEGLNNIVEHALPNIHDRWIHVEMRLDAAQVFVHLQDSGAPLPGWTMPNPQEIDLHVPVEDLPEGGFGWSLIHMLTSRLDYCRSNGVNRLKMWFSADAIVADGRPARDG